MLAAQVLPQECDSDSPTAFTNPILPGWNSDPTCAFVAEWDDTTFCSTSSFMTIPGAPVYASKDLVNWKLASHAFSRPEQLPLLANEPTQLGGIWASSIRFHQGALYLITVYQSWEDNNPPNRLEKPQIVLFKTTDPYDDDAWSVPVIIENPGKHIDPEIFWDGEKIYMLLAHGWLSEIDIKTGASTEPVQIWEGLGGFSPEGPRLYRKDDHFYIMQAEGGTGANHSEVIARSRDIWGPYEAFEGNAILTNRDTDEYFQNVGHADLFQDSKGDWWGVALTVRGGPASDIYPMGREMALFAATWDESEWPVLEQVRGNMTGPLPARNTDIPGNGHFINSPDIVDFAPGSKIPSHFLWWRSRDDSLFEVSPAGHPNSLRISPSAINLTGPVATTEYDLLKNPLAFVVRKQETTLFNYTVDVSFTPSVVEEEAGISLFLNQLQHLDLGIVNLPACGAKTAIPHLRFRVEASGKPDARVAETVVIPVPKTWLDGPISLHISGVSDRDYTFGASPSLKPEEYVLLGAADGSVVSGGGGLFTGSLLGAYATNNGGKGTTPAYFSRWRYLPVAQQIGPDEFDPATK
ncbi:xylosidase/arabinosidase [Plectosphaerella plurivora]|uniref:Xylosidase/arabinosidase n=1 Tax=Plectosphaerella plurivora TaxID=936078 RepID=A0A9P9ACK8_9PEZI|nr:xylosidase/arabinosidase [Plectosphaerella plurivora]